MGDTPTTQPIGGSISVPFGKQLETRITMERVWRNIASIGKRVRNGEKKFTLNAVDSGPSIPMEKSTELLGASTTVKMGVPWGIPGEGRQIVMGVENNPLQSTGLPRLKLEGLPKYSE